VVKTLRGVLGALVAVIVIAAAYVWSDRFLLSERRGGRDRDRERVVRLLVFSEPRRRVDITWRIGVEGDADDHRVGAWTVVRSAVPGTPVHLDARVIGDVGDDPDRVVRCDGYVDDVRVVRDQHEDKCAVNFEVHVR